MKVLMFIRKALLEFRRSPQLLWIYLLFPSAMVLLYYLAFGMTGGMANYLTILVNNRDSGNMGAQFVQYLETAEFDGKPVFTVIQIDSSEQAEVMLDEGRAAMLLTLPIDFSRSIQANDGSVSKIEMLGDPLSDTYSFAQSFIQGLLQQYVDHLTGWTQEVPLAIEFLPHTGTLNDFQVGVPGLVIFGVLFGVIIVSLLLTHERSAGTIRRLKISKAESIHLLGGISLATLLLSVLQMLITFGVAYLVGFKPVGSLWLAIAIGLLTGVGATGAGFIAASLSKSEGEATGFGTAIMALLVFLSGALFPMPSTTLFTCFGQTFKLIDVLPSTHASAALSGVVLYGKSLVELPYDLFMLAFLSILWLGVGIAMYQRLVLRKME